MKLNRCLTLSLAIALCACTSSAFATLFQYEFFMDGPSESPANASPATGFATADYDNVAHTLAVNMSWSGLTGTTTAGHIHATTPSPNSGTSIPATTTPYFTGFPIGVTSGTYASTLDLTLSSSYNPSFVTASGGTTAGAEAALTAALANSTAYMNIHSTTFGSGEIRGFSVAVPEPTTCALVALGMSGIGCVSRRRRS